MIGPGKYDDECSKVRESAQALLAAVIIIGGNKGTGFSVQTVNPHLLNEVPGLLRHMADEIEKDLQ